MSYQHLILNTEENDNNTKIINLGEISMNNITKENNSNIIKRSKNIQEFIQC